MVRRSSLIHSRGHFANALYQPFQDMITNQVAAINRLLLRADAFCIIDPTCPFHAQGKGAVVSAWESLLAKAIASPLPAAECGPGKGCNTPVTATDLRLGASVFLRTDPDFPRLFRRWMRR